MNRLKSFISLVLISQLSCPLTHATNWVPLPRRCDLALALKQVPLYYWSTQSSPENPALTLSLEEILKDQADRVKPHLFNKSLQLELLRSLGTGPIQEVIREDVVELVNIFKVGQSSEDLSIANVFSHTDSKLQSKKASEGRLRVLERRFSEFQESDQSAVAVEDVAKVGDTQSSSTEASNGQQKRIQMTSIKFNLDENNKIEDLLGEHLIHDGYYTHVLPLGYISIAAVGAVLIAAITTMFTLGRGITDIQKYIEIITQSFQAGSMIATGSFVMGIFSPYSGIKIDRKLGKFINFVATQENLKRENSLHSNYVHYGTTFRSGPYGKFLSLDLVYVSKPNEPSSLFAFVQEAITKPNFPKQKKKKEDEAKDNVHEWLPGGLPTPERL